MMVHEKSPIVGEAITSMEFTMYEPGSGSNNEAVNLPIQTSESTSIQNSNQDRTTLNNNNSGENPALAHNQTMNYVQSPVHTDHAQPNIINVPDSVQRQSIDTGVSSVKQNQEVSMQTNAAKTESNFKYLPASNLNSSSGRLSSCSNSQDIENNTQSSSAGQTSASERAGSSGPQNQLLKQLLGNCSSADSPNQDSSSSSLLIESSSKITVPAVGHTLIPKQIGGSGIPTISFQMDPNNKNSSSGPIITGSQPGPIKGTNMIASSLQPQQRPPNSSSASSVTQTNNYEIKTYNVAQQVQPTMNLNIQSVPVRVQQLPTHMNTNQQIVVQKRPGVQIIARTEPIQHQLKAQEQQHTVNLNQSMLAMGSSNIQVAKKVKTQNGAHEPLVANQPLQSTASTIQQNPQSIVTPVVGMIPSGSNADQPTPQPVVAVATSTVAAAAAISTSSSTTTSTTATTNTATTTTARPIVVKPASKRKINDSLAERRAALEKEKTPPPREVKPKRRARGPNKRSRGQMEVNDEFRTIDSNSNTSEASQLPEGAQSQPPKKRVRKSQSKASKIDFENSESMLSSLAMKIHNELPVMSVKEPEIRINNNVGSIFACGDLNSRCSKLRGPFGKAVLVAGLSGPVLKKGKRKAVGYYHEEFPTDLEETSLEMYNGRNSSRIFERDCDSPGSIVSGSSSDYEDALDNLEINGKAKESPKQRVSNFEKLFTPDLDKYLCVNENSRRVPNKENVDSNLDSKIDINNNARPMSPSIPTDIRLPITHISISALEENQQKEGFDQDNDDNNKENLSGEEIVQEQQQQHHQQRSLEVCSRLDQSGTSLNMRLKEHGNVSVTLTLTNKEADGVKRVLNSLSQLIDYPIQPSCVMQSQASSLDVVQSHDQDRSSLGNSFRLLTGASHDQTTNASNGYKDIKFNEQNYVAAVDAAGSSSRSNLTKSDLATVTELADIKPEFCSRCKAIVVDRGIRKNIDEIPAATVESMHKSSIIKENQIGELVFCSVHCYAASIMCSNLAITEGSTKSLSQLPGSGDSSYLVKAPAGLPPMSPMMEDDEDDMSNNNSRLQVDPSCKSKVLVKSPTAVTTATSNTDPNIELVVQRKRWTDIRYTRWTPSYFELNKSTSPIGSDDFRESAAPAAANDNNSQSSTSHHQLINHNVDSSVDSNESDNSTSYSQSTSGKLGNTIDDTFGESNQDLILNRERQLAMDNRYKTSRGMIVNRDVIPSWPEGVDLIQVKPIRNVKPGVVIKKEKNREETDMDYEQEESTTVDEPVDLIEMYEDTRKCVLCHEFGDGDSDGPARLLNLFLDGWVHLNCALWSLDVYELANGALMNVELACKKAMTCSSCHRPGATLKCFKPRCPNYYHFLCATKERCSFYEDKSVQCRQHSKSDVKEMTSFVVKRRVYVDRDEQKQVAEMIQGEQQNVMRIGSLIFLNIGQLLPHQLMTFHDKDNIFPVGYKIIRYYWSFRRFNKRCKYLCTIEDNDGKPLFRIVAQEIGYEDEEFRGESPQAVWHPIIDMIVDLRKEVPDTITTFPAYIRGEDLFGLNEPSIVRILESLPGIETLNDYNFKFGRSPLLELPLAINPTGCARTEPKLRTHFKRPYTIHHANSVPKSRVRSLNSGDTSSPYVKQFVHSKSAQYRKMKSEWRNNVVLARSRVQGLGLYAARDIEKHTMVIEYVGMVIRNEISDRYEKLHEAHNRGIYMFRLDDDRVIDATLSGGLARYINHSCNPNCITESIEIDRERKIVIIASRKILKGEELGYDYKLATEDDQQKISCLCGAPTCKKWL